MSSSAVPSTIFYVQDRVGERFHTCQFFAPGRLDQTLQSYGATEQESVDRMKKMCEFERAPGLPPLDYMKVLTLHGLYASDLELAP